MLRLAMWMVFAVPMIGACATPEQQGRQRAHEVHAKMQELRNSSVGNIGCTAEQIDVTVLSEAHGQSLADRVWEAVCNNQHFICRDNPSTGSPTKCAAKVVSAQ